MLITPSAVPVVLLNVRRRPLTKSKNCVGPTAPIESGGKAPVSVSVAAVNSMLTLCAKSARGPGALSLTFASRTGVLATATALGSCGRFRRSGSSSFFRIMRHAALELGGAIACAAIRSAVVRSTPKAPTEGTPTVSAS